MQFDAVILIPVQKENRYKLVEFEREKDRTTGKFFLRRVGGLRCVYTRG